MYMYNMVTYFLSALLTGTVVGNGNCSCSTRPYNINTIPVFCMIGAFVDCHAVIRALGKEILSNKI